MNKLITKIATAMVGIAMAVGVGVAVGSKASAPREARADQETLTFSSKYNSNTVLSGVTVQGTNISATFAKNSGNTDPQYYTNGTSVRFYKLNSMTVSAGGNTITAITITFGGSDGSLGISTNVGTYSNGSWSGSASSVIFTAANANGNRRLSAITVTYGAAVPEITVPNTISVTKGSKKTISVAYANLTDDISVSKTSGDGEVSLCKTESGTYTPSLSLSKATASPQTIYVKGESNGTVVLTFTSSGATAQTCTITVNNLAYSTGFEDSEGFTASTVYNNTIPASTGPTSPVSQQWSTYYGTPSTANPLISGSQSMQMRRYSGMTGNPYTQMMFDISEAHIISFKSKSSMASGYGVEVFYSTDSGSNYTSLLEQEIGSSSVSDVTATIPTYVEQARFRIEFTGADSSNRRDLSIDDVQIFTMDKPTNPTITITSKDGTGAQSGVLGDTQEITYETENDTGLTVAWEFVDTANTVEWDDELCAVAFESYSSTFATLTAKLMDGQTEKASDTVTLKVLQPSVAIKYQNQDRAKLNVYPGDTGTLVADVSNMPIGLTAAVEWSTTDPNEDYIEFNNGEFEVIAVSESKIYANVNVKYKGSSVANDSLEFTTLPLADPTLVVSTGEGTTSYKFGEQLDKTGWSATYTDGKGQESEVIGSLDFGSIEYIGTKTLTATYGGATSNGVSISVTNNGATAEGGTTSQNLEESSTTTKLVVDAEHIKTLNPTVSNVTQLTISFDANATGNNGSDYTHTVALKAYDENDEEIASQNVEQTIHIPSSNNGNGNYSHVFNFAEPKTVAKVSYTLVVKADGSNLRQRSLDVNLTYGDPSFAPKQALAWAQYFIDEVGGLCDAGGNTSEANVNAIKAKWSTLSSEYGWMIKESKDYFAEHTSNEKVARVLGMYRKIVSRYGQTAFITDGDGDPVAAVAPSVNILGNSESTTITAVVIISVVSVAALGGYFFLRRRKEQ